MAKADLNPIMLRVRGAIGDLLFRSSNRGVVLGRKPAVVARTPSAAQLQMRERFQLAIQYATSAMLDPLLGPLYVALGTSRGVPARSVAAGDYLNPPKVIAIDITGYHGAVGNLIKVKATDDVGVTGVTVRIRAAGGGVIEEDAATVAQGTWTYEVTSPVAAGTAVTVEAVAADRAGNTGTSAVPVVVG